MQLAESVRRSTQAPLQVVSPAAQLSLHIPAEHTCGGTHALPQAPQLFGSDATDTQPAPQSPYPLAHTQAPLLHCSVGVLQTTPHVPQWAGLARTETQVPPHRAVPAGQPQDGDTVTIRNNSGEVWEIAYGNTIDADAVLDSLDAYNITIFQANTILQFH